MRFMLLSDEEKKEQLAFFKNRFVKTCDICHGEGFVVHDDNGYEVSSTCKCLKKAKRYLSLLDWGIPKRYLLSNNEMNYILKTSVGKQAQNYVNNFNKNYQDLNHVFINGVHTASSLICAFLAKQIIKIINEDTQVPYTVAYSLFSDVLKLSFENDNAQKLNTFLYKSDVLILDGIGGEFIKDGNKFSAHFLDNIIRKRENDCKLLILVSAQDIEILLKSYGEEIVSFINQCVTFKAEVVKKDSLF